MRVSIDVYGAQTERFAPVQCRCGGDQFTVPADYLACIACGHEFVPSNYVRLTLKERPA